MVSNKYFAVNGNRSCRAAANRDVARPSLHFQIHWPTDSEGLVERALRRGTGRRSGNRQRPQRNLREWKAPATHTRTAAISSAIHVASLPKGRSSQKPKPEPHLLQHHLVALFQHAKDFGLRAVRDSDVNRNLVLAFLALRIGNFDRSLFILVVENSPFRNLQDAFALFKNNFRVGCHLSFE